MAFTDPAADIQAAILAKLRATAAVAALVRDRIYDRMPSPMPAFPFITFGNVQVLPELADGIDAARSAVTVHAWDRFADSARSKPVGAAVVNALHDEALETADSGTQSVELESSVYFRDPDGLTNHAVLTFNVLTDANA